MGAIACTRSFSDPSLAILSLQASSQSVQQRNAVSQVEQAEDSLKLLRQEVKEARERAREAQKESGFWADVTSVLGDDLATIAGVVAAGAAVVATGGAGAPVVLLMCASAGMTLTAKVAEKAGLDPKLTMALSLGGAALGLACGNVQGVSTTAAVVAGGARAVQGGAVAASGATSMVQKEYEAQVMEAHADAKRAELTEDDAARDRTASIEQLARLATQARRSLEVGADIQHTSHQARQHVVSNMENVR